ncbi:MAG: HIT family protein [Candidatus Nanoarchaeia archaeon]|jgi:diadenosine tetraphosphate (Ap4A) HIT family hydrolase
MNENCEICKRVSIIDPLVVYEDKNVIAKLSVNQISLGKTSVYYKKHVTSFTQLSIEERASLMESVTKVGRLLEKSLKPDHMNYSLLGNYFPHLHWHLIPRYENKSKDHFFFGTGLEPCHMGREIKGRYEVNKTDLIKLVEMIKNTSLE